jgi:hypothetical protein
MFLFHELGHHVLAKYWKVYSHWEWTTLITTKDETAIQFIGILLAGVFCGIGFGLGWEQLWVGTVTPATGLIIIIGIFFGGHDLFVMGLVVRWGYHKGFNTPMKQLPATFRMYISRKGFSMKYYSIDGEEIDS